MLVKSKSIKHTILIDLDLLTSNGLIIKSRFDFNDISVNLNISN